MCVRVQGATLCCKCSCNSRTALQRAVNCTTSQHAACVPHLLLLLGHRNCLLCQTIAGKQQPESCCRTQHAGHHTPGSRCFMRCFC